MATFPLRELFEEQLPLPVPDSLISVSPYLYNTLVWATNRRLGERKVQLFTMEKLQKWVDAFRMMHPNTVVRAPLKMKKVHLSIMVVGMGEIFPDEREVTVLVKIPITAASAVEQDAYDQRNFFKFLAQHLGVPCDVENGGFVLHVKLYGENTPVQVKNPDDRHGQAWKYFMTRREAR